MTTRTAKQKYTVDAIEKILSTLQQMPKVDNSKKEIGKTEAVGMLAKEIKNLQARGYTMKMIADILRANEFEIGENVLKSYIARSGKTAAKTTPKAAKKTPPASTEPVAKHEDTSTPKQHGGKKQVTEISDVE